MPADDLVVQRAEPDEQALPQAMQPARNGDDGSATAHDGLDRSEAVVMWLLWAGALTYEHWCVLQMTRLDVSLSRWAWRPVVVAAARISFFEFGLAK